MRYYICISMDKGSIQPSLHNLEHQAVVEHILGEPLLPEGINFQPTDPDRTNTYIKAHELSVVAIQHVLDIGPTELVGPPALVLPGSSVERLRQEPLINFVAQQVAIANEIISPTRSRQLPLQADQDSPRAHRQAEMQGALIDQLLTLPQSLAYSSGEVALRGIEDAMAAISPTGSGKTVVEALLLRRMGVGLVRAVNATDGVMRARLITSSRKLVKQFVGMTGDTTFTDFLGKDIRVTHFFGDHEDDSGDVVITTRQSSRKLDPRAYGVTIIDEGHRGLEPKTIKDLTQASGRMFFFTATPANRARDLRQLFKNIEIGSLLSYVEDGILSPVRLLTFQYKNNPEVMAAQLAHSYIQAGRKVAVYCQRGSARKPSYQARTVAALTNELCGTEIASSVGVHNKQSDEDEAKYAAGELRMLSTCQRLTEGWNEDVDVVITIGSVSELNLRQRIGRAMRPGKFVAELVELLPEKRSHRIVTIWQQFGLENVDSGLILKAKDNIYGGPAKKRAVDIDLNDNGVLSLELLPKEVRDTMILDNTAVRTIALGGNTVIVPPEGSVNAEELAKLHNVPLAWLHRKLDEQQFSYTGIWPNGLRNGEYQRWYTSEVNDYIEKNPFLRLAEATEMNLEELADMFGTSRGYIVSTARSLGIEPIKRLGRQNGRSNCFDIEGIRRIGEAIEAIPIAEETDVPFYSGLRDSDDKLSEGFAVAYCSKPENNMKPVYKRRHPKHGIRGFCMHITEEQDKTLREIYKRTSIAATDEDMSLTMIASLAGVARGCVVDNLTAEEQAALYPRRVNVKGRASAHLPKAMGLSVVERLKVELPPHLVPFITILTRIPAGRKAVSNWLTKNQYTPTEMILLGRKQYCYSWHALWILESTHGIKEGQPVIDYDKLVRGESDTDLKRWEYTQSLQRHYQPGVRTAQPPTSVATPPNPQMPAVRSGSESTPISSNRVDIIEYLASNGAPCDPVILIRTAQRLGLHRNIVRDPATKTLLSATGVARQLEEAIKAVPMAPPTMISSARLAADYSNSRITLTPAHILHVAKQVLFNLESRVHYLRAYSPDGQPGRLELHFDNFTAGLLRRQIIQIKSEGRIGSLLRFSKVR